MSTSRGNSCRSLFGHVNKRLQRSVYTVSFVLHMSEKRPKHGTREKQRRTEVSILAILRILAPAQILLAPTARHTC